MQLRLLVVLAFIAGLLAAPGARANTTAMPPLRTAAGFFQTELLLKVNGHWGKAWRDLYPAHRLVAPRAAFVRCERQTPFATSMRNLTITKVQPALVRVPGLDSPVAGAAVTVRVALQWYGRDPIMLTHTFHVVPVAGRWTWLLSPEQYKQYSGGACTAAPAA